METERPNYRMGATALLAHTTCTGRPNPCARKRRVHQGKGRAVLRTEPIEQQLWNLTEVRMCRSRQLMSTESSL
jgi:hypothetical protein